MTDAIEQDAPSPGPMIVTTSGWTSEPDTPLSLTARQQLTSPRLRLTFPEQAAGPVTAGMTIRASGIGTLRLRVSTAKRQEASAWIDLAEPSLVHHTLPFLEVLAEPGSGMYRIECDLAGGEGERLRWISLEIGEPRNWRVHPGFPGGNWFNLAPSVPAGASLWLAEFSLTPIAEVREAPAWQGALNWTPPAPRQPEHPRDAVIFSSWIPEDALPLGAYFLDLLKRRQPGAKHFIGVNHGASPEWPRMIAASGLDADIIHAGPGLSMPYDPSGFVAALDAYRRSEERFGLVWFGHTKGGLHLRTPSYGQARWALERWFWSAREEVERAFAQPETGVWAPHWLMFQPEHLEQTDALRRMYAAPCAPLGAMAVSAHYVMRDECLREFVEQVDPRFFTLGPEPFGGDRYFFEFAVPNIPLLQGWSAAGPAGEGGDSGYPANGARVAVLNDWRQNNAMMRHELERWRHDPVRFLPRPVEHVTLWDAPER
ncbi:MAG: hypothetical protein ACR2J8_04560 [Thermomicrobiales bacterium]